MVLHRAFTDYCSDTSSAIKKFIFDEWLKVCTYILTKLDIKGKSKLEQLLKNLTEDPLYNTQEHVPSMQLLLGQMLVLHHMKQLDQITAARILPKLIEEMDRRSLDQNLPQTNDKVICTKYLSASLEEDIQKIILAKIEPDNEEDKVSESSDKKREAKNKAKQDNMEVDKPTKSAFWAWEGEECKGGNNAMARWPNFIPAIIDEFIKKEKWITELSNSNSELSKIVKQRTETFFKYQFWFKHYAGEFLGQDSEFYQKINNKQIPLSHSVLAAIVLQNLQSPKSSFKKTAIESKEFIDINNDDDASKYFKKVITSTLRNTLEASLNNIKKLQFQKSVKNDAENFAKAEDEQVAIAYIKRYKKGRGDVNIFLDCLHKNYAWNVMNKIKLIFEAKVGDSTIFSDKRVKINQNIQNGLSQKKIFQLWLNCCIRNKSVSEEEFFGYFLSYADKKDWWNKYFDENGEPKVVKSEEVRAQRRGQKAKWRKRRANKKNL